MKDFVKKRGLDLLYGGRIAAPRVVYKAVDAAVMLVHGAYGFPHAITRVQNSSYSELQCLLG